jgi:hypothetical protein
MKKVTMIRFAMPVSKVLKNFEDLSFYRIEEPRHSYLSVWYDGNDFIIENSHLFEGQNKPRKVYVAKTNVAQWEIDDTERESTTQGNTAKISTKSKP